MASSKPFKPGEQEPSLQWVLATAGYLQRADLPDDLRPPGPAKAASVLIPLFWHQQQWQVLFIRRVTNQSDRHSGQVAFPGGRKDPSDTDTVATALREAQEEIGLDQKQVDVIHVLEEYHTSSNYVVTPVVGIVPWPYEYIAQPTEVDRIFSIPLAWLANEANAELRDRPLKKRIEGGSSMNLKVVYYNEYDNEVLWGASARMTISLLNSLYTESLVLPDR